MSHAKEIELIMIANTPFIENRVRISLKKGFNLRLAKCGRFQVARRSPLDFYYPTSLS